MYPSRIWQAGLKVKACNEWEYSPFVDAAPDTSALGKSPAGAEEMALTIRGN